MDFDKTKIQMHVPCMSYDWDGREAVRKVPAVDCSIDCKSCGFNPAEQARRRATGKFIKHHNVMVFHFKKGE